MKLGVAGIVSEWSKIDAAAAARVRENGFRGATIFFNRPLEADLSKVRAVRKVLDGEGVEPAQANGAYEALLHSDEARVELRIAIRRDGQCACNVQRANRHG